MLKKLSSIILATFFSCMLNAQNIDNHKNQTPEFSIAGYFQMPERIVQSMNIGWRFHKGDVKDAQATAFDDKQWSVVNIPNGIDLLPMNASGCNNYQGIVWYRKHFTPLKNLAGQKLFLHFEAVMGKCKVFVNGKLLKEHFGGYLPFSVDVTDALELGKENLIAVWADNSDDQNYPPGKAQVQLDFSYFGGIYRDVYLIAHNKVYVTDANYENEIAGGGLFITFNEVSEKKAIIEIKAHVKNETDKIKKLEIEYLLCYKDESPIKSKKIKLTLDAGKSSSISTNISVKNPKLWSPETPHLYRLIVKVNENNKVIDSVSKRVGIRSIEFKGKKGGFYLNGKPYGKPLLGGNRHQDFAVIGNALPNSIHYRDAKKLRDIGMKIVRNAHYPQDPAFMDACDELGLFVIVNTPGWQFWNKKPIFGERVKSDIRQMVRRDRNHPCVLLWEPVLNETWYPENAAKEWLDIIYEEFPAKYCYAASDVTAKGAEHFPVLFPHPLPPNSKIHESITTDSNRTYFIREWGDYVDSWNSQNSPSRVNIEWGEAPQLVQAIHYAKPNYPAVSLNSLHSRDTESFGGTLWHSFDHQRGYHSDPFYGGVFTAFRMPKYSAYMFKSQQDPKEAGPMVFIAHEMTPFSPKDVTVFSNCDSIILTMYYSKEKCKTYEYVRKVGPKGIRYPLITFKDVFYFWLDKTSKDQKNVNMKADGFIDGKKVATHVVNPARRPTKILLYLDNENVPLRADGSDMVTIVAAVSDANGNIKKLNNESIQFTIEGEGRLVGDPDIMANPKKLEWGKAPILVQSTTKPGKIKVTASLRFEGSQKVSATTLEFNSLPAALPQLYDVKEEKLVSTQAKKQYQDLLKSDAEHEIERLQKELNALKLKEVEKQQEEFGEFK